MIKPFKYLLSLYRKIAAYWLFPACRFYPSCSHYAGESVERYGLISGLFLASKRLIRCNQFFSGGYDPVLPVK